MNRKKWTEEWLWRYKKNSKMGTVNHAQNFGLRWMLVLALGAGTGWSEDGAGRKGLFKGRSSADSAAAEEARVQSLSSEQTTSAPVAPVVNRQTYRPGDDTRFTKQGEVRLSRNAVDRSQKVAASSQQGPYNPKFGMPTFSEPMPYDGPQNSKGGLSTARGTELTMYTPVEIREDRKKPTQQPEVPAGPTPEDLQKAAERKKDLFDEIYMAKSTQPPLTFDSTVDRGPVTGPGGVPVATRNVGERVLKQFTPTTKSQSTRR
ncbi:MAG: hypothetical protein ABL994_11040 [Verrucomicrobiales bacterium]